MSRTRPGTTRAPGPGVRSLLRFGPQLLRDDAVEVAVSLRERYGHVVRIPPIYPGLDAAAYLATHPDDVRTVLQTDPTSFRGLDVPGSDDFAAAVRGSILGAPEGGGDWWVRRFRRLSPEFNERHVATTVPAMVREATATFDEYLGAGGDETHRTGPRGDPAAVADGGDGVRVKPLASRLSLRLLGASLLDGDVRVHEATVIRAVARLRRAFKRRAYGVVTGPVTRRLPDDVVERFARVRAPLRPDWIDPERDPLGDLHAVAEAVVARRERFPRAFDDAITTWRARRDPITGETLSRSDAVAEVAGMLIAGFATVSAALTWAVFSVATRPDLQDALAAEAADSTVLHGTDGSPSYADLLADLPLATRVWRETLRLYPTLPVFGRTATEPVTLSGYDLEPGSTVLVSPFVTHRDPAFWDRPTSFDPDRFRGERPAERPEFAYYPFSAGPHGCLGRRVATGEAVVSLATLVGDYRFTLCGDPDAVGVDSAINLEPDRDVRARFEPRAD